MARLNLEDVAHAYVPEPAGEDDWALKPLTRVWRDGGAYALLGPSGCGKTTLLNIISGLLRPRRGKILFDGADMTALPPERRDIAQVFQFPVVYDTMTTRENLAFPLRNRGASAEEIARRVARVAETLELTDALDRPASGLTPDAKQKISLGRGLARERVNAILLDEPLTVIDPHLKWRLRASLKRLHQSSPFTMIYVTHDQTEALTFADQVAVMSAGRILQVGTPSELFERPRHSFVGHFIGSPGMNFTPCKVDGNRAVLPDGTRARLSGAPKINPGEKTVLGIRPEHLRFSDSGTRDGKERMEGAEEGTEITAEVLRTTDAGRLRIVEARAGGAIFKASLPEDAPPVPERARLFFPANKVRVYADDWLREEGADNND